MTISTNPQPPFIIDLFSEVSTLWPEGSIVFCKETGLTYILNNGTVDPIGAGGDSNLDGGNASSVYGGQTSIDGGGA